MRSCLPAVVMYCGIAPCAAETPVARVRHRRRREDPSEASGVGCARPVRHAMSDHGRRTGLAQDRKSTRLNSSHSQISYAVFCLKKKKQTTQTPPRPHTKSKLD